MLHGAVDKDSAQQQFCKINLTWLSLLLNGDMHLVQSGLMAGRLADW